MTVLSAKSLQYKEAYQQHYAENGWVSIEDLFTQEFAEETYAAITSQPNWEIATLIKGKPFIAGVHEFYRQPANVRRNFMNEIQSYALKNKFQYHYEFMRLIGHEQVNIPALKKLQSVMKTEVRKYLSEVTSRPDTSMLDAQLTRFTAGHFLKTHCDTGEHGSDKRHTAYVVGFTRDWEPDYGGLLQMMNQEGEITQTLIPKFNTVNMFKVPTDHFVSPVANYCTHFRISITGWLWHK